MSKAGLRAAMRAMRRALAPEQRAAEQAAAVAACRGLLDDGVPASYAAQPGELDLAGLHADLWRRRGAVYLPRVAGGGLVWHTVIDPAQLRPGAFGISEPDPQQAAAVELPHGCLVLVPGLAYTADRRRLGQGGGYYDRLLTSRPDLRAVGVGFSCQLLADLPSEAHDAAMTALVIAGRVLR